MDAGPVINNKKVNEMITLLKFKATINYSMSYYKTIVL